jgi:diadenosine tetraphosphatase ApaH/serine/threonine PP2A family protein phosphatase
VGHLHIPLVIVKEKNGNYDGWQLNDGDVMDASKFEKVVVNVGSVGQPRDADPRASFGIFDTEKKTIEIRKVEYNIQAVQERMRKADLPDFLIERLKYGR